MNRKRGFTLVELLVVIAIIALLISLLLPALSKAIRNGRSLKDGTQVKEIHQSMVTFASNNKGKYPTPGQIDKVEVTGLPPNSGAENYALNHTRCFYSAMIAQEFFPTKLLIGPTEVNPKIVDAENYNFSAYNPGQDQFWDDNQAHFNANISAGAATTGTNAFCNTSYAHMTICGNRKKEKFRDTAGGGDPVIGTRGLCHAGDNATVIVNESEPDYFKAQSLLLHDPKKSWGGNVTFGDDHNERLSSMYFSGTSYEVDQEPLVKDNLYFAEFIPAPPPSGMSTTAAHHREADAFLSISIAANADGNQVTVRPEPLIN